ncbi:hypothetical protein GYA28_01970 [Candidatus Roizmanbacteria bacterium]|nr:hypothetical protein [Candidatus Roizmanbacteria bacterium]
MSSPQEAPNPPIRETYSREKVFTHIQKNLIRKTPETLVGRKCGDGRDDQNFMEALFGSDLGYVFACQAGLRDMEALKDKQPLTSITSILDLVSGNGDIYIHTDDHDNNEQSFIGGCGANKVARKHAEEFGITDDDFRALDGFLSENSNRIKKAVYRGGHKEGAVLIVSGKDYGVRGNDTENGTSVFVVQSDMVYDRLRQLTQSLSREYGLDEKELYTKIEERFKKQMGIIGDELAKLPDGTPLPSYSITFEADGTPIVIGA